MQQIRSPITRRRALVGGVGAAVGSLTLPRRWFTEPSNRSGSAERNAWPMDRHDPARTGYTQSDGPTEKPTVAWQTTVGDEHTSFRGLVCSSEQVYLSSHGQLIAVDAETGKRQWEIDRIGTLPWTDGKLSIQGPPSISNDRLIVTSDTTVYALDPADGSPQWGYKTNSSPSAVFAVGNTVYIASNIGNEAPLAAVDTTTGLERWKTRSETGVHPQAYAQGRIVGPVIAEAGTFGAVEAATGSVEWTQAVKGDSMYRNGPCITNDTVYWGTGPVYALALEDGAIRWTHTLDTTDSHLKPVSDGSSVYLAVSESNRVLALDGSTGDVRWHKQIQDNLGWGAPTLTDEMLYIGLEHGVVALDTETGAEQFRVQKTKTAGTDPILAGSTLYVMLDKTLYALEQP